ncbi:MAG: hypothetical protein FRX49_12045 [Trebouxia sp. A1-2]|nr:MAG: hypothetical protein FRX49_12045 [Trebouxia sp. A1-2]
MAYPVTTAGPRALAGLMHIELTGPKIHMSKQIARGTARDIEGKVAQLGTRDLDEGEAPPPTYLVLRAVTG